MRDSDRPADVMDGERNTDSVRWLGHSSTLIRWNGLNIITDPVLGDRCGIAVGPFQLGPKRLTPPALRARDLPPIDLVLLSHAHFDHFDLPTLNKLQNKRTEVITARATADLLRASKWKKVTELGWGEEARMDGLTVRALQVRHWGARMQTDRHRGYNGYVLEMGGRRLLFGGDTANTDLFREARSTGPIELAIMPIGAYNPWIGAHCTPEQAVRMASDAGADRILPVHHKTFRLSAEPFDEPIERFRESANGRAVGGEVGDSVLI